jgi:hypothetical protein
MIEGLPATGFAGDKFLGVDAPSLHHKAVELVHGPSLSVNPPITPRFGVAALEGAAVAPWSRFLPVAVAACAGGHSRRAQLVHRSNLVVSDSISGRVVVGLNYAEFVKIKDKYRFNIG